MERIFKFPAAQAPLAVPSDAEEEVSLRNRHLHLSAVLASRIFGPATQAHLVYYAHKRMLLLAPADDETFKQLHKCSLQMLKTRQASGARSVSLEEILLDHDLDDSDRPLAWSTLPDLRILQVHI